LETRTKRGFPHSHSDYGDGTRLSGKTNPAKFAGPVGFLNRTFYTHLNLEETESLADLCPGRKETTILSELVGNTTIQRFLETLTEDQGNTLILHFYEGHSFKRGSHKPTGKRPLLFAYLHVDPNHP
jgi:hypothetical protein